MTGTQSAMSLISLMPVNRPRCILPHCMNELTPLTIQQTPFNAETPLDVLVQGKTPTAAFYVRNHFDVPKITPETYRLQLALNNDATLLKVSMADIMALPRHEVTVTLECAGNGRSVLDPVPPGVRWGFGAVGTTTFAGVPLRALVDMVGLAPGTTELVFEGADRGEVDSGKMISFVRSLPLEVAIHPDTLLAWEMDGEPLTPDHGFPLRLVVPRWYGVASVKWLKAIRAVAVPFEGYYQTEQYRFRGETGTPYDQPVTTMRVRALIATPSDGEQLSPGTCLVKGSAWSGSGRIALVELSTDGGMTWLPTEIDQPASSYAAAVWRTSWSIPRAGTYVLIARATDANGNSQPLGPVWNEQGYGNNGVQRVKVHVV